MPWCHHCDRMVEDDELAPRPPCDTVGQLGARPPGEDVTDADARDRCPTCGTELDIEDGQDEKDAPVKAPWHFKVLVVGTVVYLGYRLYQGIGWLIHHA